MINNNIITYNFAMKKKGKHKEKHCTAYDIDYIDNFLKQIPKFPLSEYKRDRHKYTINLCQILGRPRKYLVVW